MTKEVTCKLCQKPVEEKGLFASVLVAVRGGTIKARWDICIECVLEKFGSAIEKWAPKILPEMIGKMFGS